MTKAAEIKYLSMIKNAKPINPSELYKFFFEDMTAKEVVIIVSVITFVAFTSSWLIASYIPY